MTMCKDREDNILELFSGVEIEKRKELFSLMMEWEKTVLESRPEASFMYDGFLPGYFAASPKVLFIGRESRNQESESYDYIANAIDFFKKGSVVNSAIYWKRILCMYNIIKNKGFIDEAITADKIAQKMIEENNYGFALMNISKYQNISENSETRDTVLMNDFFNDSKLDKRNFLEEEIALLDPDLIITANLWCCGIDKNMKSYFGKLTSLEPVMVQSECAATLNSVTINEKTIKLIDFYHFSNHFKGDMDYYYKPLSTLWDFLGLCAG